MSCPKKKKAPEYQRSVTYVSDGRNAMWHLPFPFLNPSDIGVRLIDENGIEKQLTTPNEFIAYWDYVVCVVPVGWRIRLWLIPPIEDVLAGRAVLPKTKQVLDSHKVRAVQNGQYDSESEDGVYIELETDAQADNPFSDVPSPELQNDRRVLVEGGDQEPITPDMDGQGPLPLTMAHCGPWVPHPSLGWLPCPPPCIPRPYDPCRPPHRVVKVKPGNGWLPGGVE